MGDAENPHHDVEQSPRDSGNNVSDPSNGREGEKFSCATASTSSNQDEEKNGVRSPVKDESGLDIKANEKMNGAKRIASATDNENLSNMNVEDQEAIGMKDEVPRRKSTESEMNEGKPGLDVSEKAECKLNDGQIRLNQIPEQVLDSVKPIEGDIGAEKIFDGNSKGNSMLGADLSASQRENGVQMGSVQGLDHISDFIKPTGEEVKAENACDFAKPTGGELKTKNSSDGNFKKNSELGAELSALQIEKCAKVGSLDLKGEEMDIIVVSDNNKAAKDDEGGRHNEAVFRSCEYDDKMQPVASTANGVNDSPVTKERQTSSPNLPVKLSSRNPGSQSIETVRGAFTPPTISVMGEGDDATPEDQASFLRELEVFHQGRGVDFKQPKFYGQPLNCLKLWRSVIRMGGYDKVTASKLWKLVGESFHPPKTCTTVSWTFRIFYEKSLLEFERHKTEIGELQLPAEAIAEVSFNTGETCHQASGGGFGSGRLRRDSAARAIQGWQPSPNVVTADPFAKDKNFNNAAKRERNFKSSGSLKQKRPRDVEHSQTSNQLASSVTSYGSPADWVKINVRKTHDCFEVYALVPGLLREEVRVQADPAGRIVITGQPEQLDNPWGITPFKKVVSLPERIDPLATSAVVSMHGRLFVRVPFEKQT